MKPPFQLRFSQFPLQRVLEKIQKPKGYYEPIGNSYEDDYEYYGWIKDHNLYGNHHDGVNLKLNYGYLIVDTEGNYGYVVTDISEPIHFEIKNLQPDPLSVYCSTQR